MPSIIHFLARIRTCALLTILWADRQPPKGIAHARPHPGAGVGHQPYSGPLGYLPRYHLDTRNTGAQAIRSTDRAWKAWDGGHLVVISLEAVASGRGCRLSHTVRGEMRRC